MSSASPNRRPEPQIWVATPRLPTAPQRPKRELILPESLRATSRSIRNTSPLREHATQPRGSRNTFELFTRNSIGKEALPAPKATTEVNSMQYHTPSATIPTEPEVKQYRALAATPLETIAPTCNEVNWQTHPMLAAHRSKMARGLIAPEVQSLPQQPHVYTDMRRTKTPTAREQEELNKSIVRMDWWTKTLRDIRSGPRR